MPDTTPCIPCSTELIGALQEHIHSTYLNIWYVLYVQEEWMSTVASFQLGNYLLSRVKILIYISRNIK